MQELRYLPVGDATRLANRFRRFADSLIPDEYPIPAQTGIHTYTVRALVGAPPISMTMIVSKRSYSGEKRGALWGKLRHCTSYKGSFRVATIDSGWASASRQFF
jgi:hypothetical protein